MKGGSGLFQTKPKRPMEDLLTDILRQPGTTVKYLRASSVAGCGFFISNFNVPDEKLKYISTLNIATVREEQADTDDRIAELVDQGKGIVQNPNTIFLKSLFIHNRDAGGNSTPSSVVIRPASGGSHNRGRMEVAKHSVVNSEITTQNAIFSATYDMYLESSVPKIMYNTFYYPNGDRRGRNRDVQRQRPLMRALIDKSPAFRSISDYINRGSGPNSLGLIFMEVMPGATGLWSHVNTLKSTGRSC